MIVDGLVMGPSSETLHKNRHPQPKNIFVPYLYAGEHHMFTP